MDPEERGLNKTADKLLIGMWRDFAVSLEKMVLMEVPTMSVARRLGYLEREMERRGIRHDDPRGDVLDSHGIWHKP